MRLVQFFALVLLALGSLTTSAAPQDQTSSIAMSIADPQRMDGDAAEDAWRKPAAVLQFMGVKPGMHVLDYFAASGYYSELLSRAVGAKGSVIVYNNPGYAEFAGDKLKQRFADNRLPNAQVMTLPTSELRLPANSLDGVLFVQSYHDLYWQPKGATAPFGIPAQVNADLLRALKPGGVVLVLDHAAKSGASVAQSVDVFHRIDPQIVMRDFLKAGFEYDGESKALRHAGDDLTKPVFDPSVRHQTDQFMYRFRKPAR